MNKILINNYKMKIYKKFKKPKMSKYNQVTMISNNKKDLKISKNNKKF